MLHAAGNIQDSFDTTLFVFPKWNWRRRKPWSRAWFACCGGPCRLFGPVSDLL